MTIFISFEYSIEKSVDEMQYFLSKLMVSIFRGARFVNGFGRIGQEDSS